MDEEAAKAEADHIEEALRQLEQEKQAKAQESQITRRPEWDRLRQAELRMMMLPRAEHVELLRRMGRNDEAAALEAAPDLPKDPNRPERSKAPEPVEPSRAGGFVRPTVAAHKRAPRWQLWMAHPSVELWQAVLLSLNIEPSDELKREACGMTPDRPTPVHRLPREFFARRADCMRALGIEGLIRPQGPLYSGMLQSPTCSVLLAEVAALLKVAEYQVPPEMLAVQLTDKGPKIKRAALVEKYERAWPDVERNLRDAAENGLSDAAKAPEHGMWFEEAALAWATQQGKYTPPHGGARSKASPFAGLGD